MRVAESVVPKGLLYETTVDKGTFVEHERYHHCKSNSSNQDWQDGKTLRAKNGFYSLVTL
jgi:hypothetical protein